jgi:uncharacterized hydrophobic protein (TIGR00271 family)
MKKISSKSLRNSYEMLRSRSELDFDYVFLIVLASIICFFGFKMNSPAVIIGSMVISPLLYSLVSAVSSVFYLDFKTLLKKLFSLTVTLLLMIFVSFIFGRIFEFPVSTEVTDRLLTSNTDYFMVALFSGIAGTFAFYWPGILETVTGIAISVALIPPVVLMGIGLATADVYIVNASAAIILINLLGIFLGASQVIFSLKVLTRKT